MGEQNDEMYFTELQACKLDFLEWTPEKGVNVSETSKKFAREFLNLSGTEDYSETKKLNGAKKTFNEIASLLIQCKAGDDEKIPRATIDEIAERSGTTDRRVYTVLEALGIEGWKPSKGHEERTSASILK
ncbi:hypothetical protein MSBRW_2263 [Methanosarcina barkeri str. Wiesmoor]|uniref:Uncharacterized protein n=2 Tax=Methanosarcina barkeri TaxID=2208 RepID=A0A0E3LLM2_METBA|nr:hypothetical protein [Methanosarcina barkeri]AKB51516.1 hypothetical protein MSBRW_2263 [Methanosarcina barkeri str. Wiesmoor]